MKQLYQKSHGRVKLDVKPVNITVYNIYFVTTAVLSLVLNFALYILGPVVEVIIIIARRNFLATI